MRRLTRTPHGLALSTAMVCTVIFGFVACALEPTGMLVRTDTELAASLHRSALPAGVATLKVVTFFGDFAGLTVIGVLGTAALVRARARLLALGWSISLIGTAILNELLKRWFARPRPSFPDPVASASGYSFPSGHSMGTTVAVTMLLYAAFRFMRSPKSRRIAVAVGATWTILMGFSRMYLGVHYLSDVVGGLAVGGAWACLCICVLELVAARPRVVEP